MHDGATEEAMWQRVPQQHEAGMTHPVRIRGWYNPAGGSARFFMADDDPRELSRFLTPFMDQLSFDVRAISQTDCEQAIKRPQQDNGGRSAATPAGGRPA